MTYQYFTVYNSMSLHNMVILLFQFLCRAWFFFLRQIKSISVIMTWIVTVTEIGFHRTIDHPSFLNLCTAMRSVEYKTRKILNRKKRFFFQRIWKVEEVPVSIVWHYLGPMNLKKKTDQKQLFSALLLYLVFSTRVFYHTKRRSRYIYIFCSYSKFYAFNGRLAACRLCVFDTNRIPYENYVAVWFFSFFFCTREFLLWPGLWWPCPIYWV